MVRICVQSLGCRADDGAEFWVSDGEGDGGAPRYASLDALGRGRPLRAYGTILAHTAETTPGALRLSLFAVAGMQPLSLARLCGCACSCVLAELSLQSLCAVSSVLAPRRAPSPFSRAQCRSTGWTRALWLSQCGWCARSRALRTWLGTSCARPRLRMRCGSRRSCAGAVWPPPPPALCAPLAPRAGRQVCRLLTAFIP